LPYLTGQAKDGPREIYFYFRFRQDSPTVGASSRRGRADAKHNEQNGSPSFLQSLKDSPLEVGDHRLRHARHSKKAVPTSRCPFERIVISDNDGMTRGEKPTPIELGFIMMRRATMPEKDVRLRDRQPWKAAGERKRLCVAGEVITKHYHGGDSNVKALVGGIGPSRSL
jgi:hypothetical protein